MKNVSIDHLAAEIMKGLVEYADLATDTVKDSVKVTSNEVKKDIQENAPKDTSAYKKSWTTKIVHENSNALVMTIHSKNRYQISHLLEHDHAKRGGGRVGAIPHIAAAEKKGVQTLTKRLERGLEK